MLSLWCSCLVQQRVVLHCQGLSPVPRHESQVAGILLLVPGRWNPIAGAATMVLDRWNPIAIADVGTMVLGCSNRIAEDGADDLNF